jgi:hypothetical protein
LDPAGSTTPTEKGTGMVPFPLKKKRKFSNFFRRNKELESDIRRLRELTSGLTRDEELLRELYIKMVEKCVLSALGKQNS